MKNKLRRCSIFALFMALAISTDAATYTGRIKPFFYSTGLYLLPQSDVQHTTLPSCVTRGTLRLEEDPALHSQTDQSLALFKQKYAMLLGLWLSGQTVQLVGSGSCSTEGDELIYIITPQ